MRCETHIIDIDGCIFEKIHKTASDQWVATPPVVEGFIEWLDAREKEGACIILMTARRESCRPELESMLAAAGVYYDELIMGITNGARIIHNDGPCWADKREVNQCWV